MRCLSGGVCLVVSVWWCLSSGSVGMAGLDGLVGRLRLLIESDRLTSLRT